MMNEPWASAQPLNRGQFMKLERAARGTIAESPKRHAATSRKRFFTLV